MIKTTLGAYDTTAIMTGTIAYDVELIEVSHRDVVSFERPKPSYRFRDHIWMSDDDLRSIEPAIAIVLVSMSWKSAMASSCRPTAVTM